jgi:transposase-like protein
MCLDDASRYYFNNHYFTPYARPVDTSWRVDETYIRVGGLWTYLYRAVDKRGLTVDFWLIEHRDIASARRFFTRAIQRHGIAVRITLDGYPATHAAVAALKEGGVLPSRMKVWTSRYLNNIVEQDDRRVKQRIYPMLGFKRFGNAVVTNSGIELVQKTRKGRFNIANLRKGMRVRVAQIWEAVIVT